RGVLDLGGGVGGDRRKFDDSAVAGSQEFVPRLQRDDLPQVRQVRPDLLQRGGHGISPVFGDEEDACRPGLPENVTQFSRFVGRAVRSGQGGATNRSPVGHRGAPFPSTARNRSSSSLNMSAASMWGQWPQAGSSTRRALLSRSATQRDPATFQKASSAPCRNR